MRIGQFSAANPAASALGSSWLPMVFRIERTAIAEHHHSGDVMTRPMVMVIGASLLNSAAPDCLATAPPLASCVERPSEVL